MWAKLKLFFNKDARLKKKFLKSTEWGDVKLLFQHSNNTLRLDNLKTPMGVLRSLSLAKKFGLVRRKDYMVYELVQ